MARNSLLCADVPLRNYSLIHSLFDKMLKTSKVELCVQKQCSAYSKTSNNNISIIITYRITYRIGPPQGTGSARRVMQT